MKIKCINIKSLGKFNNHYIEFNDELTYIYGENEVGKSTIFEALKVAISGFSSVKNYKYIPIGSVEASVFAEFDSFSVERRLSRTVVGYYISNNVSKKINNNPVYNLTRDVINDMYIISSDDIFDISKNSFDSIIDCILYDSNLKKYHSLRDITKNITNQKKELYSNRKNSNKTINLLDKKIKNIESELYEYSKKEKMYVDAIATLESNVKSNSFEQSDAKERIRVQKEKIAEDINVLKNQLLEYQETITDDESCIGLNYRRIPFVIAILSFLFFAFFSQYIFCAISLAVYFVYKLAYFSKAIKITKIPFLYKSKWCKIKAIQERLFYKRKEMNDIILKENKLYENVEDNTSQFKLETIKQEFHDFHLRYNIKDLKQKVKDLRIKREEMMLTYNRYSFLENLFEYSKDMYVNETIHDVLSLASHYLECFTNGKYNKVVKSDNLYLISGINEFQKEEKYLSSGTKSQLYLALRLALIDYLDKEDSKPLFFDDAFIHFDKKRLHSTLEFLKEYSKKRQVIIFSSTKYESLEGYNEASKKS